MSLINGVFREEDKFAGSEECHECKVLSAYRLKVKKMMYAMRLYLACLNDINAYSDKSNVPEVSRYRYRKWARQFKARRKEIEESV